MVSNLSYKEKQELINSKLLNIDGLALYIEKVYKAMKCDKVNFPVLAIIETLDNHEDVNPFMFRPLIRKAVWKYVKSLTSPYNDGKPSFVIEKINFNERILGFITMDTPWEEIYEILQALEIRIEDDD